MAKITTQNTEHSTVPHLWWAIMRQLTNMQVRALKVKHIYMYVRYNVLFIAVSAMQKSLFLLLSFTIFAERKNNLQNTDNTMKLFISGIKMWSIHLYFFFFKQQVFCAELLNTFLPSSCSSSCPYLSASSLIFYAKSPLCQCCLFKYKKGRLFHLS